MKKLLLSIVGMFGIFSFCFGDTYTVDFSSIPYCSDISSSNPSCVDLTFSNVFGIYKDSSDLTSNLERRPRPYFYFTGFYGDVFLDEFCLWIYRFDSNDSYYYSGILGVNGEGFSCFTLSGVNLKDSNYIFGPVYYYSSYRYRFSFVHYTPGGAYSRYFSLGNSSYLYLSGISVTSSATPVPKSITLTVPTSPKFKVNYGNTSYEYELNDNLSIYLKSSVIQNGDTFIYNGKTGLNLFYNGLSQQYNKSKLYLKTPSWFNNNIFTPVCL